MRAAAWSLTLVVAAVASSAALAGLGAGCSDDRRPASPGPTTTTPSCSLPVCDTTCACDETTSCDPGCSACDPECRNCRAEGAECSTPRDAGPRPADSGTPGPGDGGPVNKDAGGNEPTDAGPCNFPPVQPLSAPCCLSLGIDACGAGLFCGLFDGRTVPSCYAEGSRQDGQTCTADLHCARGRCPASTGVCGPGPGDVCFGDDTPCAGDGSGRAFTCDPQLGRCIAAPVPCDAATHQPCANGESCYVTLEGGLSTACFPTGSRGEAISCSAPSDCQRDLTCFPVTGQGCLRTCTAARPCRSGETCQMLDASVSVGICAPNG